ncbi:redoxin family protein [Flavobacterium akiainvivens]|uniref:redoxin family protein n=1 Tax=Flavobacterium akiainvivens TaxID=1202724 RepID=UPI0006C86C8C|nr:redoxin family protein [Flavobacterium akiainvivens]SFQ66792.1 hypothetical protein SAMN05444144_11366 [Flavobacterium akiainvivens]
MNMFTTALKAEHIKKKGTGLYWVSVILGAFMPLVYCIAMVFDTDMRKGDMLPFNYYQRLIEQMLDGYASFFFPLLIIISVSRITQLDHRNGGWQLMETQPLRKLNFYFAKFSVVVIGSIISVATLMASCYLFGSILLIFKEAPKDAVIAFEAGPMLLVALRLFLASLFLTAVQYLISVLISSFIWSVLIGFFLLLAYLFLNIFNVIPDWYPLETLGKVAKYKTGSELGYWITYSEVVSILLAVFTLYLGFNWYRHKNLKRAFLTPKRGGALVAMGLVFIGATAWVLMPNMYDAYGKTIIAGRIDSKQQFKYLYVTDNFVQDTIAKIPVTNNEFHYEIKQDIPLDVYMFKLDGGINGNLVMGNKDSIYILARKNNQAIDGKITGTRLAENKYKKEEAQNWSEAQWYLQRNEVDDVTIFTNVLVEEWKDAMADTDKFKTADNYVFRQDFVQDNKKAQTITYLNYWQDFVKKRKAIYPDKPTPESPGIAEMKKTVSLNDEGMLSNEAYFDYVRGQLIAQNNADIDENVKALQAIEKLKPGTFKDKMLYWQLKEGLNAASARSERDSLVGQYADAFTDAKFAERIGNLNKSLQNIDKGQPAPAIAATGLDKKPFTLEQYKGKLIAIDVWATWCAPCREESPKFEKLAIKYKNQPVEFVAISTDRNITDWYVDARQKSKSVLQVHANDGEAFGKDYIIEFIPRFILIDKDGKLINANMPRPSQKTFEETLRRELGLPDER